MPILHIRLTKNNQNINLPKPIHAQKLTFLRSTIVKDTTTGGTDYNGNIMVDLDFFDGYEVVSSINDNYLIIPVIPDQQVQTFQFVQLFNSENIRQSFNAKIFDNEGANLATIGTGTGQIKQVDLYFQITSLYDYNQY